MLFKSQNTGERSVLNFVNHDETYGRHIVEKICKIIKPKNCLDIGAGNGEDLKIVRSISPEGNLYAIDFRPNNESLLKINAKIINANIEYDDLPIDDNSLDFVIANQTMEHIKEIYWINHQVFKKLAINGYFLIGVPNLLALHNRVLPLFGYHPTCIKMISAHIRGYSIKDTSFFYNSIGKDFLRIEKVYGSQFYPFPRSVSRIMSKVFPSFSTCIFFLIRKIGIYETQFIDWPKEKVLETNYFIGNKYKNNLS